MVRCKKQLPKSTEVKTALKEVARLAKKNHQIIRMEMNLLMSLNKNLRNLILQFQKDNN